MKINRLLAAGIICLMPTAVCNAEGTALDKIVPENNYAEITVSGTCDAGGDVLVKLIPPGKSIDDISADSTALYFADQFTADTTGAFARTYILPDDRPEGKYKVYCNDKDTSFWYISDKNTVLAELKQSVSQAELNAKLFTEQDIMQNGETCTYAELLDLVNTSDSTSQQTVSEIVFNSFDKITTVSDLEYASKIAETFLIIKSGDYTGFADEHYKTLSPLWTVGTGCADIEEIYNATLNDAGRKAVLEQLAKSNITSTTAFENEYCKAVCMKSVNNSEKGGHGHIDSVLQKVNAHVNMNTPTYFALAQDKRSNVALALQTSSFADFNSMCTVIETLANAEAQKGTGSNTSPGGGSGSGGSKGSTGLAVVPVDVSKLPSASTEFTDIGNYAWAKNAIESLAAKKIVSGVGDSMFEPARNVKREEFVTMLALALGLSPSNDESTFSDVKTEDWFCKYVMAAKNAGIVSGRSDGRFGAGEEITRQDCCVLIASAKNLSLTDAKDFADMADISEYAKDKVMAVRQSGIVSGDENNNFNPLKSCSRAEAAVMIFAMLNLK